MAKPLDSGTLSVFAESIAMMLAAGIQTDEAVHMLASNTEEGSLKSVCDEIYLSLIDGAALSQSMKDCGAFPTYAVEMVRAGEESGFMEDVLNSLATYYNEEERLFAKTRSAILYPAALLAVMTAILAFTVTSILPVFLDLYSNISGELLAGSFAYVKVSIGIGYAALVIMAACTVAAIAGVIMSNSEQGRARMISLLERIPLSHDAMYHMALARFCAALSTYVSAGVHTDMAMHAAINMTDNAELKKLAQKAYDDMIAPTNPKNLAEAINENEVFDPLYSRMLLIGSRSGSVESVLNRLTVNFFDDAVVRIDSLIDTVEPTIAGFLTLSVGATLIAVMMPLIGIMGSIA